MLRPPDTPHQETPMTFKNSPAQFQIVDPALLLPDAGHPRRNIEADSLKGLVNSIGKMGLIHPIVVRPAAAGRYTVIAGERRRQAALLAGEAAIPVVIRDCAADAALEVQVFENMGLGVRSALEPRDMAGAIQAIATRFENTEAAAEHFARPPTWLNQATAAANLSEKVSTLLETGKISSTGTALKIEKLAKKDEARAESLIDEIEQLPEGEKTAKKLVDRAIAETSRRRKADAPDVAVIEAGSATPPWEAESVPATPRSRVNPGKVRKVAELLGLSDGDEEEILVRLIDEFLALKSADAG